MMLRLSYHPKMPQSRVSNKTQITLPPLLPKILLHNSLNGGPLILSEQVPEGLEVGNALIYALTILGSRVFHSRKARFSGPARPTFSPLRVFSVWVFFCGTWPQVPEIKVVASIALSDSLRPYSGLGGHFPT